MPLRALALVYTVVKWNWLIDFYEESNAEKHKLGGFQKREAKCVIGGQNSKSESGNDVLFTSFEGH